MVMRMVTWTSFFSQFEVDGTYRPSKFLSPSQVQRFTTIYLSRAPCLVPHQTKNLSRSFLSTLIEHYLPECFVVCETHILAFNQSANIYLTKQGRYIPKPSQKKLKLPRLVVPAGYSIFESLCTTCKVAPIVAPLLLCMVCSPLFGRGGNNSGSTPPPSPTRRALNRKVSTKRLQVDDSDLHYLPDLDKLHEQLVELLKLDRVIIETLHKLVPKYKNLGNALQDSNNKKIAPCKGSPVNKPTHVSYETEVTNKQNGRVHYRKKRAALNPTYVARAEDISEKSSWRADGKSAPLALTEKRLPHKLPPHMNNQGNDPNKALSVIELQWIPYEFQEQIEHLDFSSKSTQEQQLFSALFCLLRESGDPDLLLSKLTAVRAARAAKWALSEGPRTVVDPHAFPVQDMSWLRAEIKTTTKDHQLDIIESRAFDDAYKEYIHAYEDDEDGDGQPLFTMADLTKPFL